MRYPALIALLCPLAGVGPAHAQELPFAFPLDCTLGQSCYIQNYVDRDPGPGSRDFACGTLSYDGHKGTDIALPTRADLGADVTVTAALPGTVRAVRDGEEDGVYTRDNPGAVAGRECGNGVVIRHGDGWETQYCHLANGSIQVVPGQTVATGTPLGTVGLSGQTEFPHLHFEIRRNGRIVDPFDADDAALCGPEDDTPLWQAPLAYAPSGILDSGFAPDIPDYDALKAGDEVGDGIGRDTPLVLWAYAFGSRQADTIRFEVNGPTGPVLFSEIDLDRTQALFFRAAGTRPPAGGWRPGQYVGRITWMRDGQEIGSARTEISMQ